MSSVDRRPSLILFYLVAFGFAWAFWVPLALHEAGRMTLPPGAYDFLNTSNPAAWGPLIGAFVAAFVAKGWAGIADLWARLIRVKFGAVWYLVALTLLPGILFLAGLVSEWQGQALPASEAFANPISIPIAFLWIFFLGGPLQEEAGWRGTASEGFERRIGALGASVVAGVLWGLWHLPLFYVPRAEIYYNQPLWGLMGSTVLLAVLLTWIYNNSGRSLFAAMLMHTSFNWANYLFTTLQTDAGGQAYFFMMLGTVALIVVLFGPSRLRR